jgi:hypothetical protein
VYVVRTLEMNVGSGLIIYGRYMVRGSSDKDPKQTLFEVNPKRARTDSKTIVTSLLRDNR